MAIRFCGVADAQRGQDGAAQVRAEVGLWLVTAVAIAVSVAVGYAREPLSVGPAGDSRGELRRVRGDPLLARRSEDLAAQDFNSMA